MLRAIVRALLALTSNAPVPTAAVAFAVAAQPAVVAIARAARLNLTNVSLPTLLAQAFSFEAQAVTRAVGHHLAALRVARMP